MREVGFLRFVMLLTCFSFTTRPKFRSGFRDRAKNRSCCSSHCLTLMILLHGEIKKESRVDMDVDYED